MIAGVAIPVLEHWSTAANLNQPAQRNVT
jgi:hypothetical protein